VRRVVSGTGKVLITLGILILLFVAYQLWGTGIYTAQAQNNLESDFEKSLEQAGGGATPQFPAATTTTRGTGPTTPTTAPAPASTTTTIPPPSAPAGDAVAHIVIPKVGVDWFVIEGVDESDLREGPGHYPLTPFPGQEGNSAIAGHRTTYGAPFGEVGELEAGDEIEITTVQGTFTYTVYDKLVVAPSAFEVLDADPTKPATLTLTTCNPKYSAAQRLIVKAELKLPTGAEPLPSSVDPDDPEIDSEAIAGDGLSGDTGSKTPTVIALLFVLLIGGLWWLLFHRHPRWTTWLIGLLPFAFVLAIFFFYLERVLPANY
jgi:sortase A